MESIVNEGPRRLTDHQVNECNRAISILPYPPGPNGAPLAYEVSYPEGDTTRHLLVPFHQGDPRLGINGLTIEVLLAMAIDRLRCFQATKNNLATRENALALTKFEEARFWLEARTRDRQARGVEGSAER